MVSQSRVTASDGHANPKSRGKLLMHLRLSLPATIFGSVCRAVIMAASASAAVWADGWETPSKLVAVATLYSIGGAIAFPLGLILARLAALGRSAETAFAAAFVGFAGSTLGVTAILFAFYAQHSSGGNEELSTWPARYVRTTPVLLFQFATLGARLYFPVGFIALLAASLWFARRRR